MNLLRLIVHMLPRQGHPVFPANQAADVHVVDLGAAQARRIAICPDHPLGIGWNQLAVMVD